MECSDISHSATFLRLQRMNLKFTTCRLITTIAREGNVFRMFSVILFTGGGDPPGWRPHAPWMVTPLWMETHQLLTSSGSLLECILIAMVNLFFLPNCLTIMPIHSTILSLDRIKFNPFQNFFLFYPWLQNDQTSDLQRPVVRFPKSSSGIDCSKRDCALI